jgi:putative SOS response-associated peptidase YedK
MCGRFLLTTPTNQLASLFQASLPDDDGVSAPRFNVAPSQPILMVRDVAGDAERELAEAKWGLVPVWARDRYAGGGLINACSETAAEKPCFREAFRRRRCLIPADGFYEWLHSGGKRKQPFLIRLKEGEPFAFAGLWESWEGQDGQPFTTAAILTTQANDLVKAIHERMPVILRPEQHDRWLDRAVKRAEVLRPLLCPFDPSALDLFPVSTYVNDARHEGPRCLEGLVAEPTLF